MKFHVLTLFPEIPRAFFESSIMAKAVEKGIVAYDLVNIRDFAFDKHKTCDDSPYGGGAGMLMLPEPLSLALKSVFKGINEAQGRKAKKRVVYVTPSGKPFNQKLAQELSQTENLIFICGRYEGLLARRCLRRRWRAVRTLPAMPPVPPDQSNRQRAVVASKLLSSYRTGFVAAIFGRISGDNPRPRDFTRKRPYASHCPTFRMAAPAARWSSL